MCIKPGLAAGVSSLTDRQTLFRECGGAFIEYFVSMSCTVILGAFEEAPRGAIEPGMTD